MASAVTPASFIAAAPLSEVADTGRRESPRQHRRRPNPTQGRALEVLGHAIEYLVDSRSFNMEPLDMEAYRILKVASQAIFYECAEVQTASERVTAWVRQRLKLA